MTDVIVNFDMDSPQVRFYALWHRQIDAIKPDLYITSSCVFLHRYTLGHLLYPPTLPDDPTRTRYTEAKMIAAAGTTQFAFLSRLFLQTTKAIVSI